MGDILRQYDWNNHKEMPQERLIDTFMKLPFVDQLRVYRTLKPRRKLLLRKAYDEFKKEKEKESIRKKISLLIEPINKYLSNDTIKTYDEALLILGILIGNNPDLSQKLDDNNDKEEGSFNGTKKKMLELLKLLEPRYRGGFGDSPMDVYNILDSLEYIPAYSSAKQDVDFKNKWVEYFMVLGTGEKRRAQIIKAILSYEILQDEWNKWLAKIPEKTRREAFTLTYKLFERVTKGDHY